MRICVVGTGVVGRTLAGGFSGQGHDVVVATRSPDHTRTRAEWAGSGLALVPLAGAADGADLVVNATSGSVAEETLSRVGPEDGVVLMDVANPLDFSAGFPPSLTVKDTDSLAEQLQRAFPHVRVVKTLNTMTAAVMLDPVPDTTVFVAGDDVPACRLVRDLLRSFGWQDIIEFHHLEAARGLEMWLPLWVRIMARLGTAQFNLKIVRQSEETPA